MLTLAISLTLFAAPPARGFAAAHTPELAAAIEKKLPQWLTGGGDLASLRATPAELKTFFTASNPKGADVAPLVDAAVKEQSEKATLQTFTANRALIEYVGKRARVVLFDDSGHTCELSLITLGAEPSSQRFIVISGPRTETRSFDDTAKTMKDAKEMLVFLEKTDGAWNTGSMPKPPPPDCATVLKGALQTVFDAEKKYFETNNAYSSSLSKIGVDPKTLGVTSAKVSTSAGSFTIRVGVRSGEMTMDEKGTTAVIAPCAAQ